MEYELELIIEVDLIEVCWVMIGLVFLSQGKLFWMNNGVSGYNDYSFYWVQLMCIIFNEFVGIILLEFFIYVNYFYDLEGFLDYNIYIFLIVGYGYWGKFDLIIVDVC